MAYIPDQSTNTGAYVPSSNVWELITQIYEIDVTSVEFKDLLVRLFQNINLLEINLNNKVTGAHYLEQFVNGKLYYNPASTSPLDLRAGFIMAVNIGALGAGVTAVNHNLPVTNTWKFMDIYGCASNTTSLNYYPLPFAGAAGNNIELRATSTQVIINNNSGVTFTDCSVFLEFVKN